MSRENSGDRSTLARLEQLRRHTEVMGQILRDLWPLIAAAFSILGVALHQFAALLR